MGQLMDQVVVLVIVFVVDEVSEVILTAWPAMVILKVLFVELSVQLERLFSGFNVLLADQISFRILFLHLFFTPYLVLLTHGAFMRWVVQQIYRKRL